MRHRKRGRSLTSTGMDGAGEWLTYAEIAARFGKSRGAIEHVVRRKRWAKQMPNHPHDLARFWVPEADLAGLGPAEPPTEERALAMLGRSWEAMFEELADKRRTTEELRQRCAELTDELANVRQDNEELRLDNSELRASLGRIIAQERERSLQRRWKWLAWALRPTS